MRAMLLVVLTLLLAEPAVAQVPDSARRDSAPVPVLPDITVITRAPVPRSQLPRAVGVLDSTALRRGRAGSGLAESLNDLPGILVADRGNYSLDQRISIRGAGSRAAFGTRGVTVLLDGVPQTLPDGQSQLSNVDPGDIDRAEVLRGSSSALYGNGAGGVVSLVSSPAAAAPLAGRARLVGGAFGFLKWSGWGSARRGPLSGTASLSRTTADGFREHSAADLRQLSLSGAYDAAATQLRVHFRAADDPMAQNPGALTLTEYAAQRNAAASNNVLRNADKAVTQQQLSMQLTHGSAAGDVYDVMVFGTLRNLNNPLATNTLVRISRRVGGARALATRHLGGRSAPVLTLGMDAQWLRDDRGNFAPGHDFADTTLLQLEYVTEAGPFAHATWSPASGWLVEAGARYDVVTFKVRDRYLTDGSDDSGDRTMRAWSGSAGISRELLAELIPYASVSTAYETPTTTELAIQQSGAGGFNPGLGPQRTTTLEVGARGSAHTMTWSLALYESWIRDAVVPFEESSGRSFYTNAGRIRNRGIEAGATVRLARGWTAQAAWTGSHFHFTEYRLVAGSDSSTFDGNRLAGVPGSFLRLGIRGSIGSGWVALDQTLSSSVWADDANSINVAGWHTTDLRVGWDILLGRTRLAPFAAINNLWNSHHVGSVTINGSNGRVLEPSPGRNIYVGLEASMESAIP